MTNRPIYLDYNATTPLAGPVREAMVAALGDAWGNASSSHAFGRRAREEIEAARRRVAALLGSEPCEIVFTSGGTESDNAAIVSVAEALSRRGRHIVISAIEHPAVERTCAHLEVRGWEVTRVDPQRDGRVSSAEVLAALRPTTTLVSVMHANHETGVIQPVSEISRAARLRGVVVHTDAAQTVGKLRVNVEQLGVDLLTVAAHKLYAPKGVGALYVRRGAPFQPFLHGASHEGGRRAGTENTPAIVGFGLACELARSELDVRLAHLQAMRDRLSAALLDGFGDLVIHGRDAERLPNTLSLAVPGVEARRLLAQLPDLAASAGAACHSDRDEPSSVLCAMGVERNLALCTLRLSVGRPTTAEEIDEAASRIIDAARVLRG